MSEVDSKEYSHTFELGDVNNACVQLISDNAESLINYIYNNTDKEPYTNPVTRIGLVLKTLLRSGGESVTIKANVIEPATDDLQNLITGCDNLVQQKIYTDELKFLRSCTLLDDLISLNTVVLNE
tara:strand:- start:33 stop:407 length:375 start_codon:yes stop_codon:yes gene_type:complete